MVRPDGDRRLKPPDRQPRYGRVAAAGAAVLVTAVAALGGLGVLTARASDDGGRDRTASGPSGPVATGRAESRHTETRHTKTRHTENRHSETRRTQNQRTEGRHQRTQRSGTQQPGTQQPGTQQPGALRAGVRRTAGGRVDARPGVPTVAPPPPDSGAGRRVVFDIAAQRVWLVDRRGGRDVTVRTYLVSGSLTDNLHPGSYSVYSRSSHAVGVDDSGTMRYMVRFTRGENAAIGFHDIPLLDGRRVQSRDQLGTPQSHGCIRQWRPDARALWAFAPVGTRVVVT